MRRLVLALSLLACAVLALPAVAGATASPKPFGKLDCAPKAGVRFCQGGFAPTDRRVKSFDGVPIDADVTLPASGDGPFPLIILLHGYSQNKTSSQAGSAGGRPYHQNNIWFASRGYAVLNHTARGFVGSCGSAASRAADPDGCARGYVHLDDTRYEARDVQHLAGLLADQGIADPKKIGVVGGSYGGAPGFMLGVLKNRVRLRSGRYAPFKSPGGKAMRIAATAPAITWSDLAYALTPNGRSLDYALDQRGLSARPAGVGKKSFIFGLYVAGQAAPGFYAPEGADRKANLTGWRNGLELGEPYNSVALRGVRELAAHHSAFTLDLTRPAPMFITTGFTDDLFPPIESLRLYNKIRARDPKAPIWITAGDLGHMRGQGKPEVTELIADQANRFLDGYLKGARKPKPFAQAFTQTCPKAVRAGGPFRASSWSRLQRGQLRLRKGGSQTVTATGGDPATGIALDPVLGGGACVRVSGADAPGTANYALRARQAFTLLGLPTVDAGVRVRGSHPELAARLWDVDPADGKATLVTRGVVRPKPGQRRLLFQLHGNAYRVAGGHRLKLELLGRDPDYLRPSNDTAFTVKVTSLKLYLPTRDRPGGQVKKAARLPLPKGLKRAPR